MRRRSLCLSARSPRRSGEAAAFDYYFGPFFPGWIDADTLAYSRYFFSETLFPGCEVESKSEARTSDSSETYPPL